MRRDGSQLSLQLLQADEGGRRRPKLPTARNPVALPRLSIGPGEAAEMLGVSRDFFDEHIKPELRIVRRGSKTIMIPVAELERWLEKNAALYPL
jgi:excisionase family DNA binding protein